MGHMVILIHYFTDLYLLPSKFQDILFSEMMLLNKETLYLLGE